MCDGSKHTVEATMASNNDEDRTELVPMAQLVDTDKPRKDKRVKPFYVGLGEDPVQVVGETRVG